MKWLKTVAKCVSNLNARGARNKLLSKLVGRKLVDRAGMSLAELVVVVGVSSVVMLGAGSVMVFVADSFTKILDKDEAEGNLTRAAYALRTIATQAVSLYMVAPSGAGEGIGITGEAGAGASTDNYLGQIVQSVNTQTLFPNPTTNANHKGQMVEVAQFHRESSAANAAANSIFLPTAIYFKTPWDTCPPNAANLAGDSATYAPTRDSCSGQLIVAWNTAGVGQTLAGAIGASGGAGGHQRALQPGGNMQVQVFDRFTALTVTTSAVNGVGSYARDSRFRLTVRYFLGLDPATWHYIPGVYNTAAKELSMEVYVGFRNNYQGRSQLTNDEPERLHGSPYYFPFVSTLQVWL